MVIPFVFFQNVRILSLAECECASVSVFIQSLSVNELLSILLFSEPSTIRENTRTRLVHLLLYA